MFFQFLLLLGVCVTSIRCQAKQEYLNDEILPICFEHPTYSNGELYVNGQKAPFLPNTMENLIYLIEKFELANPDMKLEDELFVLLKNYTAENVYYQQNAKFLAIWTPSPAVMTVFDSMWEPNQEKLLPAHTDPFENNEKCSLFFMLSHTVNVTARPDIDPRQKSYTPTSPKEFLQAPTTLNTHIPREQGVVAINGSKYHAVASGRVLLGLYVGLKDKNERIKSFESFPNAFNPKISLEHIQGVDSLYLVTVADQLIFSQYTLEESSLAKAGLGGNGRWESVQVPQPTRTSDSPICPTVYELPDNSTSAFTFSSVRGGVDGLILGEVIRDIYRDHPNVRLSQILRMYYGRNGLQERSNAPASDGTISFCKRLDQIFPKEVTLKDQMKVFVALVSRLPDAEITLAKAIQVYDQQKGNILMPNGDAENGCKLLKESKVLGVPKCETAVDVIFVLDTTSKNGGQDLETQQEIIGHLANHLDMWHGGGTLTVFSDQKNNTSELGLMSVINNTTSSACAACTATQFQLSIDQQADKDFVIFSVSEVLRNLEEEEKVLNGVRGKVVIFFNFLGEEIVTRRLQTALRVLYTRHTGVQFVAVGNTKEVLKTYAQDQLQNVLSILDHSPQELADTLAQKICEVPSKLQYDDCKNRRNEPGAVYEGLISRDSIQRWAMHPKYFLKSLTPKMFFQSDSQIEVCHSRAYSHAENQKLHCQRTGLSGGSLQFNTTNPCQGFNERNCAPWYFTVTSVENADQELPSTRQYCQDTPSLRCKTLDQMKFKVSHQGIRCSSSPGLFATPALLLSSFALILIKLINIV